MIQTKNISPSIVQIIADQDLGNQKMMERIFGNQKSDETDGAETYGADADIVTLGSVLSADGTRIGYRKIGRGPGLIVLHGGMRASQHYRTLAEHLAGDFTVYIPDRRGRGLSGGPGADYTIDKEVEDLAALMEKTGARRVFGHSGGGLFALEAALCLPIDRLALYEPAVSIHGSMPLAWIKPFERALDRQDMAAAFAHVLKGLQLTSLSRLPAWLLILLTRLLLRVEDDASGDDGAELKALLPTLRWETRELLRLEALGLSHERYAAISANTLLLNGDESPAYLIQAAQTLETTLPHAARIELAEVGHNAPDQDAPYRVAVALKSFFAF